jgi:phage terminase large subunit-like protein
MKKRFCQCGCKKEVSPGKKYINGHARRGKKLKAKTKELLRTKRIDYLKKQEESRDPHRLAFPKRKKDELLGDYYFRKFEYFCNHYVTHIAGKYARQPVRLMAWQKDIFRKLLGTLDQDGKRVYKNLFLFVARKNGKSFLTCLLVLFYIAELSFGDPACEVVSCASTRDQSMKTIFRTARLMVAYSPELSQLIRIRTVPPSLTNVINHGIYEPLSSDAPSSLGRSISMGVFDETHTQPNSELWDAIRTSQSMREQSLLISISTAGSSRGSFFYELYSEMKKIQADPLLDAQTLVSIHEAPESMDWRSPEAFLLANPAIGSDTEKGFRPTGELKQELKRAIETNSEGAYKQFYLNWFAQHGQRTLVRLDQFDACHIEDFDIPDPKDRRVVGGLDLSSTTDLSGLGIIIEPAIGSKIWVVMSWSWLAGEDIISCEKRDRLPYSQWLNREIIFFEGKPTIQIDAVLRILAKIKSIFPNFRKIGYDPYLSSLLKSVDPYFELIPVAQQYSFLSPALKTLKSKILEKELQHNGDPLLRSCVENSRILTDPSGNIRLDKSKSMSRIDPLVALNIAASVALKEEFRR